ncbi:hypothetical protein VNO80_22836 [Phaseolus coccineus]|uniref:Glycosyl transferase 48 domain-containing protein n=1 Tax=Phaseolus coccineus TaxID=3886 RepID=A0AAN9M4U9_PHACN
MTASSKLWFKLLSSSYLHTFLTLPHTFHNPLCFLNSPFFNVYPQSLYLPLCSCTSAQHTTNRALAQKIYSWLQMANLKFTYVVSCQIYGQQKQQKATEATDIAVLLQRNEALRVAFIHADESTHDANSSKVFYSKLVKADINGKDQEIYSIKLPGDPKLGEGKPENQNHAIIFTHGEAIQTIDMNQVKTGTPKQKTDLAINVGGENLWQDCSRKRYKSSSNRKVFCESKKCPKNASCIGPYKPAAGGHPQLESKFLHTTALVVNMVEFQNQHFHGLSCMNSVIGLVVPVIDLVLAGGVQWPIHGANSMVKKCSYYYWRHQLEDNLLVIDVASSNELVPCMNLVLYTIITSIPIPMSKIQCPKSAIKSRS